MYQAVERGCPNTESYCMYFRNSDGHLVSPMHDIPMYANADEKIFNMVVEVPRWSNAKMEISLKQALNPIKQDIKKGKLRYVANCFPHHGYIWNYGAIPQTWEDPNHLDVSTGCKGDGDPIDVCEIGHKVHVRGSIVQVKILGTLALIDEGETDWKVICIDVADPLAEKLNDIEDVEKYMPGFISATVEWFQIYKMPDGKPENRFAFGNEAKNRAFTLNIVEETHEHWKKLVNKTTDPDGISCSNTTVESPYRIDGTEAEEIFGKSADPGDCVPLDSTVDKWHFCSLLKKD